MYFSLSLPAPPEIQTQQATRRPTKMSTPIPADAPDSSQSTVVEMSTALTCTLSLGKSVSGINIPHGQDEPIFAATLPHRCQAGARQGHGLSMEKERWLEHTADLTLHPDNKLSDQIDFTLPVPDLLPYPYYDGLKTPFTPSYSKSHLTHSASS